MFGLSNFCSFRFDILEIARTKVRYYRKNMSGHSKWSTIKRQKGANDAKRGLLFSKLARGMTLAARKGGASTDTNLALRLLVDKARQSNMPKENISRSIERATAAVAGEISDVLYEGYGPGGISILVEGATDNKNRTTQEIKNIFERGGGTLGIQGSVAFQFERVGQIFVEKGENPEERELQLIDLGVEDVQEVEDGIEVYTKPEELYKTKEQIESSGIEVKESELVYRPKTMMVLDESDPITDKAIRLLETLDENDDVQKVYTNFN